MNARIRIIACCVLLGVLPVGGSAFAAWFYSPMPVEGLDMLNYCACGYSTVRFADGKITMMKFLHPTIKSGQQIGAYRVAGDKVEIDILSNGQVLHQSYTRCNLGLLNPPGIQIAPTYYALNSKSAKTTLVGKWMDLRSNLYTLWDKIRSTL